MQTESYVSIKEGNPTKRFFALKPARDEYGMTIIFSGKDYQILESIKKKMKSIVQLLRHMKLKVHKVKLDQDLLNSMS